jgi:hypothetical protein
MKHIQIHVLTAIVLIAIACSDEVSAPAGSTLTDDATVSGQTIELRYPYAHANAGLPVRFSWERASGVSSYEIQIFQSIGDTSSPEYSEILTETSTVLDVMKKGRQYFWRVVGLRSSGRCVSEIRPFTVVRPDAPTPLNPVNNGSAAPSPVLQWSGDPDYDGYELRMYEGISDLANPVVSLSTLDTTVTVEALKSRTDYSWKVGGRIGSAVFWSPLQRFTTTMHMSEWTECTLSFAEINLIGKKTTTLDNNGHTHIETSDVSTKLQGKIFFLRNPSDEGIFLSILKRSGYSGATLFSDGWSLQANFTANQILHAVRYVTSSSSSTNHAGHGGSSSSEHGFDGKMLTVAMNAQNEYRIDDPAVLKSLFTYWMKGSGSGTSADERYSYKVEYQRCEIRPGAFISLLFR